jgi:type II secretory pathway component PulM
MPTAPLPLLIAEDDLPPIFLASRQNRSKQVDVAAYFRGLKPLQQWLLLGAASGVVAVLLLALCLLVR